MKNEAKLAAGAAKKQLVKAAVKSKAPVKLKLSGQSAEKPVPKVPAKKTPKPPAQPASKRIGRPPLPPGLARKNHSVALNQVEVEYAVSLGAGNLSKGVSLLIEMDMKRVSKQQARKLKASQKIGP